MKKLYLFLVFFSISSISFGQGENNYWYFGAAAGINFALGASTLTPTVLTNANSGFNSYANGSCVDCIYSDYGGGSSVSKPDGSLLFYTNGRYIYNKLHQPMAGTFGFGDFSTSKQTAIIFKNPANSNQYYVFCTGGPIFTSNVDQWGFWITLVDFTTNTNGQAMSSQHFTDANTFTCEANQAITITKNSNGDGFWILMPKGSATSCPVSTDQLLCYSVSSTGVISTSPVINLLNNNNTLGRYSEVKVSSNQFLSKVCTSGSLSPLGTFIPPQINVYPFDRQTGQIGSRILSYPIRTLSTEFSSDGNLLYAIIDTNSCYTNNCPVANQVNRLVVFDLTNPTGSYRLVSSAPVSGSLQRAIDGNIYFTNQSNFLYKIDNQNSFSTSSISTNTIYLGRAALFGLPQLVPILGPWPSYCPDLTLSSEPNTTTYTYTNYSNIITNANYNINQSGQDIKMYASNSIVLKPNTYIKSGSNFSAKITSLDCSIVFKSSNDSSSTDGSTIDKSISIYPNPTSSMVTISSNNQKITGFKIYSMDGKLIYDEKGKVSKSFQLDISDYSNGIYIINIETDNGEKISKKLIKQ